MKIRIVGDPFSVSGYSLHCREVALGLIKAGHEISVRHVQQDPHQVNDFDGFDKLDNARKIDEKFEPDISLQIFLPAGFDSSHAPVNVGMFFYEADRLPDFFVEGCNRMNAVIVPSEWLKVVVENSGVTVPVITCASAYNHVDVDFEEIPGLKKTKDTFVFFSMFQWGTRKGFDTLFRAYWSEFKREEDVVLFVKTYGRDFSEQSVNAVQQSLGMLKTACGIEINGRRFVDTPRVVMVYSPMNSKQIANLYKNADCFVLPTRGEGWGRIYLDAVGHEVPIIATNWSAHMDFLNDENAYLIDSSLEPCIGQTLHSKLGALYPITANMAYPNLAHLRKLMREVYENRHNLKRPKKETALQYTPERSANEYVSALRSVLEAKHEG